MKLNSTEIKRLICAQCDVPNPFNVYTLDREKELPKTKDVVDFILYGIPKFRDNQECEDKALQTIAVANRIAPEWCHGIVTGKRLSQGDVHTACIFIDHQKKVQMYDPDTAMYISYPFEIRLVVIF